MPFKRKRIAAKTVENLAKLDCTYAEIASVVGCTTKTLQRRFGPTIDRGRESGKVALRRKQFNKAVKEGNPTMLIWLGKQRLGQKDHQVIEGSLTYSIDDVLADIENDAAAPALEPIDLAAIRVRSHVGNGNGNGSTHGA